MHLVPYKLDKGQTKPKLATFPTQLNILGKIFSVKYVKMASGDYGETLSKDLLIKINKKLPIESMHATLIHEMAHAALGISGLTEVLSEQQEEAVVTAFENCFSQYISLDSLNK